ncbi:MAG: cardiolipin synthase [Limosilactobacillus oris]|jgi:cardiolipin synthase|uniref:cardiolipin synthase n=1 Tax=Limosilactobacillus oris TaxID=1632 RepID=UPI00242D9944|nr:cardiolipin synthase [Limosilactobacillus oris]MCH3910785.1 cardiolipin synthase [Limosilactobacillus oris]MCH3938037.1 cardiolipin synthase [Limosilactobacillus oris]MCI1981293.1 cardiolipin synthase [Limosilactobacillus oris]MCI2043284.1 cardiolipin synthase [Limosilactobacillus oris]
MNIVWTWDVVRWLIEILWLINIAFAIWTVFRTRRDIASTWAWLLVLSALPIVGFILYLFVGRKLSNDDIFNIRVEQKEYRDKYVRQQERLLKRHKLLLQSERLARARQLVSLSASLDSALVTFNNRVKVFIDGKKLFQQMIADFDQAEDHIYVEFYTFYSDNLGKRVLAALERAAKRGVKVKVLYDLSGSRGTTYKFFAHLEELGGEAQPFNSKANKRITTPRLNYHLHRKIVAIDGKLGYIGGFNIGDQYLGEDPKFGYWRDTHLRVAGQAVIALTARFGMDWNTTCRKTKKERVDLDKLLADLEIERPSDPGQDVAMQIVSSGPDNDNFAIRRAYESIISSARQYVYIQTPYLIPGEPILESLIIAARSGIDVRVMIPCMPDHPFVYRATEYYAKYLVNNKVKVYKYNNGFIHAKTMVSGNNLASVGSANQDYRSYRLNFEVNAFTYNEELTAQLKQIFENDIQDSTLLTPEYFDQQSNWRKFKQYFSRLLSPVL